MKVNSISSTYQSNDSTSPNFKAKGLSPEILDELNKNSGKFTRFLNYAGEHQGEALNILVTAFGTAIVCPMFIRFNPFSKEDKQTRAYSAWRQPISAIIAVAAQLTITKWFNNFFAKMAGTSNKNGEAVFKRADLRDCPPEGYLKQIIKLEHPEWDKKQVESAVKARQMDIKKAAIERDRKLMKDTVLEYKDLLSQEYLDNTKENLIFKEYKSKYAEEIKQKFGKEVEDVGSIRLNKFLESKLKAEASSAGMDVATFVQNRAATRMECDVLSDAAIKGYLRKLVDDPNDINKISEAIKFSEKNPAKFKEGLVDYIRTLEPNMKAEEKIFGTNVAEEVKAAKINEFAEAIVDKLRNCVDYGTKSERHEMLIKNLGKDPKDIIQNIKIKKFREAKISDAKKVFKTMNTQVGLIVTLLTLPITCGILNWAYPRIMEKIMPEMAAKKKSSSEPVKKEGGNK